MLTEEIRKAAKENMELCSACPVCDCRTCRGRVAPGPGGAGNGENAIRSYDKVHEICINMDIIQENVKPDTSFKMFGKEFAYPFFVAPIGLPQRVYGPKMDDISYAEALIKGCGDAGILAFTGGGPMLEVYEKPVAVIERLGGLGIPTMKSFPDDAVLHCIELAVKSGAPALAMDIDCVGLIPGGGPFIRRSEKELAQLIQKCPLPLILKGVMTPRAAKAAVDAGAKGIVVSSHGGRLSPSLPAPIEVLEAIADSVRGQITIFVDGGFRSGEDVFKALALGANAVLIGRPFAVAAYGGGAEGVKNYAVAIGENLRQAMLLTGANTLAEIKRDMVRCSF